MELGSKATRILRSTENVDGQGAADVNSIAWSPDGTRLLLELEVSGALANIDGSGTRWKDSPLPARFKEGQAAPLAWWSNSEALFIWRPTKLWNATVGQIFSLNLKNASVSGNPVLRGRRAKLRNVRRIDCNSKLLLIMHADGAELFTRAGDFVQHWTTPNVRLRYQ